MINALIAAALTTAAPPPAPASAPLPAPASASLPAPASAPLPAPASYPHSPPRPGPGAKLTVSYAADAGYAAAVRLTCDPAGGVHPHAERACATLTHAGGDPGAIKPAHTMCLLIYAPITAKIAGGWHGRTIEWTQEYGNSCEMRRATGVLFDF